MSQQQEESLSSPEIVVGKTRIRDAAGYTATIMYLGPVASASSSSEIYAGVIWDDKSRGKHNGSVVCKSTRQLVQHFHCEHPTGASFIRLSKLDTGIALTPNFIVQQRYVELQHPQRIAPQNQLEHVIGNKVVELHGEVWIRQYQQLQDLKSISLRRMGISSIDTTSNVDSWRTYQHLLELDLAGNLLSDWSCVQDVLNTFPNLESLSLACNRLNDLDNNNNNNNNNNNVLFQQDQYPKLQRLNLNQVNLQSITTLLHLGRSLPKLQELCIAHNAIQDWDMSYGDRMAQVFANLRLLDCSDCQLNSSQDVAILASLPSLQSLSLDENPIDTFPTDGFAALQHLQLAHTKIASWRTMQSLERLTSLRLRHCPLITTYMGAAEARYRIIAQLPNLQHLNGSSISEQERIQAERRYLAMVARLLSDDDLQQQQQQHPQYARLRTKHADFITSSCHSSNNNDDNTKLTILNVTVTSMAAGSCTMPPWIRRLPSGITIGRLKMLLWRHFGLDHDLQLLHWKNDNDSSFPMAMEDNERTLAYYGVTDGAEILLNEVDVEAERVNEGKAQHELQTRMEQQEQELHSFQERQQKQQGQASRMTTNAE